MDGDYPPASTDAEVGPRVPHPHWRRTRRSHLALEADMHPPGLSSTPPDPGLFPLHPEAQSQERTVAKSCEDLQLTYTQNSEKKLQINPRESCGASLLFSSMLSISPIL